MERFIELVKKKMLGEQTAGEEEELNRLLESKAELREVYEIAFSRPASNTPQDRTEAEKAYAVHFVKMHLQNQFKK